MKVNSSAFSIISVIYLFNNNAYSVTVMLFHHYISVSKKLLNPSRYSNRTLGPLNLQIKSVYPKQFMMPLVLGDIEN